MKQHKTLIAAISLGLTTASMAGSPAEAAAPSGHTPWTLEAALLYLEASDNDGAAEAYNDQDSEEGYRISLAYQPDPSGWGGQLTYMNWEGTWLGDSLENGPELESWTFEIFKPFSCNWCEGTYSIGVRRLDIYEPYSGPDVDYNGIGPVVGVELTKSITGPYSAYFDAETALIFGKDKSGQACSDLFTGQFGIGVQRDLNLFGADGYVKLGYEWQYYHSATYNASDATIDGFALAVGCSF